MNGMVSSKNAQYDRKINQRGAEYNRAVVTVQQNKREEELTQGSLVNMMTQQQIQQQKQELLDLASKIDLQQKMLDNKLMAAQAMPAMSGLPQLPNGGLPQLPQEGDPYAQQEDPYAQDMGGDPYAQQGMQEDPYAQGMPPMEQGMPPMEQGMPGGNMMMPQMY